MKKRTLAFAVLTSLSALGQSPDCSSLQMQAAQTRTGSNWNLLITTRARQDTTGKVFPSRFRWEIRVADDQSSQTVLSGGVGLGKTEGNQVSDDQGQSFSIKKGHPLLIGDFDLKRDLPDTGSFSPDLMYRIYFQQEIEVGGRSEPIVCTYRARSQKFSGAIFSKK